MGSDQASHQRAASAALIGLMLQMVLTVAMALAGLWAQSPSLYAATWYFLGGMPVWVVLWMIYRQHELERIETLGVQQVSGSNDGAIFDQEQQLHAARHRLASLYKWGLPLVSLGLALYLLAMGGVWLWLGMRTWEQPAFVADALGPRGDANPGLLMAVMAAIGFVAFIGARYQAGMTRVIQWQLLRGGAGVLMGHSLVAILLAVAALCSMVGLGDIVIASLRLVIPGIMLVIGLEIVVVLMLGAYRPRRPGEAPRPAFDSRLLGWLTSPESLAKIISDTINYQFGFEVSRSWFYQLLSRSITPLLVFGALVLVLISSIYVVDAREQAVETRFGQITRIIEKPGLYVKWPWPIGRADRYPVQHVWQLVVGSYLSSPKKDVAILWTNKHMEGEEKYLITAPTVTPNQAPSGALQAADKGAPGMSLVAAQVNVIYRISDLRKYVTSAQNPTEMLSALADRRVNAHFVARDIDYLIGPGRLTAGDQLQKLIQEDADQAGLGIQLISVAILGIHPPQASDVATTFHEQVGAIQKKETAISQAQAYAIEQLAGVAGSVEMAHKISSAIGQLQTLRMEQDRLKSSKESGSAQAGELTKAVRLQEARVEELLTQAPGKATELLLQARAYRWETAIGLRARAARFDAERRASGFAPDYYRQRMYYQVLAESLEGRRKVIVGSKDALPGVYRLDLKDAANTMEAFLPANK